MGFSAVPGSSTLILSSALLVSFLASSEEGGTYCVSPEEGGTYCASKPEDSGGLKPVPSQLVVAAAPYIALSRANNCMLPLEADSYLAISYDDVPPELELAPPHELTASTAKKDNIIPSEIESFIQII
jgi:hypothetical protein